MILVVLFIVSVATVAKLIRIGIEYNTDNKSISNHVRAREGRW